MLPIKPHFDRPASTLEGFVPQAHARVDPLRLDVHFPKLPGGASALAQIAAQAPGERMFGAGHWMPTLAQQHQAKVAATPSAQLVVAHTDVNGRFIDGSGRVDVGPPNFDEFPLLRRLGGKALEGMNNTLTYGLGVLDWFNPTGVIPTPQARYAMKKTQDTLASTAGFIADLVTDHAATLSQMASAPLHALDAADELSRQGRSAQAAQLRADVIWGFLGTAVSGLRLRPPAGMAFSSPHSIPTPRVDLVDRMKPNDKINYVQYEYVASPTHYIRADVVSGVLGFAVRVDPALRPTAGGGKDMVYSLWRAMARDGVDVQLVELSWSNKGGYDSSNYKTYLENKKRMPAEEAAIHTWSGKLMRELNYSKVVAVQDTGASVKVYLAAP